jgi:hypothetical protein
MRRKSLSPNPSGPIVERVDSASCRMTLTWTCDSRETPQMPRTVIPGGEEWWAYGVSVEQGTSVYAAEL